MEHGPGAGLFRHACLLPGGAEALYAGVGRPATDRTPFTGVPDPEEIARWASTGPMFGLEVVGPPLPADA